MGEVIYRKTLQQLINTFLGRGLKIKKVHNLRKLVVLFLPDKGETGLKTKFLHFSLDFPVRKNRLYCENSCI